MKIYTPSKITINQFHTFGKSQITVHVVKSSLEWQQYWDYILCIMPSGIKFLENDIDLNCLPSLKFLKMELEEMRKSKEWY